MHRTTICNTRSCQSRGCLPARYRCLPSGNHPLPRSCKYPARKVSGRRAVRRALAVAKRAMATRASAVTVAVTWAALAVMAVRAGQSAESRRGLYPRGTGWSVGACVRNLVRVECQCHYTRPCCHTSPRAQHLRPCRRPTLQGTRCIRLRVESTSSPHPSPCPQAAWFQQCCRSNRPRPREILALRAVLPGKAFLRPIQ